MKNFRSLDLAIELYDSVSKLEVSGNLKDQLNRAASSISLNLAEGNARGTAKDKRNFFHNAYGSLRECQVIFKLLKIEDKEILGQADALGANLYKLVNSNLKDSPNWRKPG